jgi:hypothetical protein
MLVRVGAAQIALMAIVGLIAGRRLWNFGLRSTERTSLPPYRASTVDAAA